ncbi:MAG: Uma2 family endonuclease [Isosphaeraceae bacterium]
MSTVPAMPPIPAESMPPVPPSTALAPTIPDDMLYEVVDGQVVEKKMSARETEIASILVGLLTSYLRTNRLGKVVGEMLFRISPENDLRRRPDVAFVSHARWPFNRRVPKVTPWDMVPDLAIEVISESNSAYEVLEKIHEYFAAGVSRVWVVYPDQAQVYLYASPTQIQVLKIGQELDGGDLLPGFHLPVAALFEDDPE